MGILKVLRGLPASGKSTWAKKWVAENPDNRARVNRDDIRLQLFGKIVGVDEQAVTNVEEAMVEASLEAGKNVVVDATHLAARYVKKWAKFGTVEVREFPIPVNKAVEADRVRGVLGGHSVGEDVIRGMAKRYHIKADGALPPVDLSGLTPHVHWSYVPGPRPAFSFDIDGTLALMLDKRGPYETDKYHLDEVNEPVAAMYRALKTTHPNYWFIGLSGRSEDFRGVTEEWLAVNGLHLDELLMRPSGDVRNDAIVKSELVDNYVSGKYDVIAHWDDRQRVVDALRAKNMTVFQVSEGDF